jgi:hypothetical protein
MKHTGIGREIVSSGTSGGKEINVPQTARNFLSSGPNICL